MEFEMPNGRIVIAVSNAHARRLEHLGGKEVLPDIVDFHGEYFWLDNFSGWPVMWNDELTFDNVEQGFVYFKMADELVRQEVLLTSDPAEAKFIGRTNEMRPDWDDIKFGIMYELVKKKFEQHRHIYVKLLETGDVKLIEGNTWHDNTWGTCVCDECVDIPGENWLGKILMSLRAQFRDISSR